MKPNNIKHYLLATFCTAAFFVSTQAVAQLPQIRNFGQVKPQVSNDNEDAMKEIEMMRKMVNERKEQQEQQRRVLQQLQEAIEGGDDAPATYTSSDYDNSYTPARSAQEQPRAAHSGSTLSQLEAMDRLSKEQQKFDVEMQMAQKEIELLKKQLTIANTQLDNCQGSSLPVTANNRISYPEQDRKVAKSKKKDRTRQALPAQKTQEKSKPQMSETNREAMKEIDMMRQMLRERKGQQDQQRKLLQQLQNSLD